jgi:hypothetical protein
LKEGTTAGAVVEYLEGVKEGHLWVEEAEEKGLKMWGDCKEIFTATLPGLVTTDGVAVGDGRRS